MKERGRINRSEQDRVTNLFPTQAAERKTAKIFLML